MKRTLFVSLSFLLVLGLVACAGDSTVPTSPTPLDGDALVALQRTGGGPVVLPPESTPYGRTYEEWSVEWWRWLWSSTPAENPGLDETGENIDFGQSGPVWFLAPNYGGVTQRSATIPTGKALLVDVAAWFFSPVIGDPEDPDELIAAAGAAADATENVTLAIDGVTVPDIDRFRVVSELFSYTLPEDNMFALFGFPTPAGTYEPAVSDGWFVMIPPLPAGEHTIELFAELPLGFGVSDVTVHLTVDGRKGRGRAVSMR